MDSHVNRSSSDQPSVFLSRDVLAEWRNIGQSLTLSSDVQVAEFLVQSFRNKCETNCCDCGAPLSWLCAACFTHQCQQHLQQVTLRHQHQIQTQQVQQFNPCQHYQQQQQQQQTQQLEQFRPQHQQQSPPSGSPSDNLSLEGLKVTFDEKSLSLSSSVKNNKFEKNSEQANCADCAESTTLKKVCGGLLKPIKPSLECKVCQKLFASQRSLKAHSVKHDNHQCYACSVCGRSFTTHWYLLKHQDQCCQKNNSLSCVKHNEGKGDKQTQKRSQKTSKNNQVKSKARKCADHTRTLCAANQKGVKSEIRDENTCKSIETPGAYDEDTEIEDFDDESGEETKNVPHSYDETDKVIKFDKRRHKSAPRTKKGATQKQQASQVKDLLPNSGEKSSTSQTKCGSSNETSSGEKMTMKTEMKCNTTDSNDAKPSMEETKKKRSSNENSSGEKMMIKTEMKCNTTDSNDAKPSMEETKKKRKYQRHVGDSVCDICKKEFSHHRNMLKLRAIHDGKSHFCDECGRSYSTAYSLQQHKKLHSDHRAFVCHICGRGFNVLGAMKNHMLIHTGQKNHRCEICNKAFLFSAALKQHVQFVHDRQRPHVCDLCGRGYTSHSALHRHGLQHSGDLPFKCEECPKSFCVRSLLKKHQLGVHMKIKPHQCPHCPKTFVDKQHVKLHLVTHTGERKYSCAECGKRFTQNMCLKRHMSVHTGERNFACELCHRAFSQKPHLQTHIKLVHGRNKASTSLSSSISSSSSGSSRQTAVSSFCSRPGVKQGINYEKERSNFAVASCDSRQTGFSSSSQPVNTSYAAVSSVSAGAGEMASYFVSRHAVSASNSVVDSSAVSLGGSLNQPLTDVQYPPLSGGMYL